MTKRLLALGLMLWLSTTVCVSAGDAVTQADLAATKELHQTKLDGLKELHQKDMEALRQQVAAVDKRVDDQLGQTAQAVDRFSTQTAWIGVATAIFSIVATGLVVLGGFLGYRNAKQEAKDAAKEAAAGQAEATAKEWFEQNAKDLKSRLEELEQKANQTQQRMDDKAKEVDEHAADIKEQQKKALATLNDTIGKASSAPSQEEQQAQEVLKRRAEEVKNMGESSRSFDDWNTLAHTAYTANNLEDAAYYWHKAAEVPHADAINVAKVLFKRGVAQGELKQRDAAIATYDELLYRFADTHDPSLREQVAKALFNKGATLNELNKHEAELATYDELLRCFGDASEPALRVPVAKAFNNKGLTQRQLNQTTAAIATYDEMLRRFADAPEPRLREQVALVLLSKGMVQRQLNQTQAEIATYDELLRRFANATEPELREWVVKARCLRGLTRLMLVKKLGLPNPTAQELLHTALADFKHAFESMPEHSDMVLGNQAYVHQLLGNTQQAEQDFAAALRVAKDGGQALYDATLKALDMHPIPEDTDMRALVERTWAAYQQ